ncbi:RNA polymerase sigma factor [Sphingomonas pruni]|uniref:RNA polymerase sigma factor n=1 Tax=Sphingomonas pruni TaxID=40683 RepID=UPI00082BE6AA|nr:sigma factor-like helix-turn-helix DNA-binding protein [Sphingomonas pruni]
MRQELSEAENLARLERAVRRLPRLQREVFLAIRLEDLDYPEIAERTGLTVEEVERHFADSLVRIANALDCPTREPIWERLFKWLTERK